MALLTALALMLGVFAGVASANGGPPPHGHILVLGFEFGPGGITYEKCVDLANNQALPLHAHHEALHIGKGGEKLFEQAGHAVIPTAPLHTFFSDCASFAEFVKQFPPAE